MLLSGYYISRLLGLRRKKFEDLYDSATRGGLIVARRQLEILKNQESDINDVDPYLLALLSSIRLTQND